jgi:2,4-dienoyl-CoA reductase-like NADH-dependent reductase (Old Yellow Enzyme family)
VVRISATDYLEHDPSLPQFTIDDAVALSKIMAGRGVDFIDVSAGGVDARQKIDAVPGYQVQYAEAIKKAVAGTGCLVGTVGEITSGKQAQAILDAGSADAIFAGRAFLKNPSLVWAWSDELEIDIQVASQCRYHSRLSSSRMCG